MTTVFGKKVMCLVCGQTSEQAAVAGASPSGSPDLDTRPPEAKRSTIRYWIQACPFCGYCAPDISRAVGASETVSSREYRAQLSDPEYPDLANKFLCWSMVQEKAGNPAQAGWASVHAAWACDDAENAAAAARCRARATQIWELGRKSGQGFLPEKGAEEAIMADLLRRSGQFESAMRVCQAGLTRKPQRVIADILRFQTRLAVRGDRGCHQIAETAKEHP